jgi:hypothetical protein
MRTPQAWRGGCLPESGNILDSVKTNTLHGEPDRVLWKKPEGSGSESRLVSALHQEGALANAAAEVMKLGAADFATVGDLDFRDPGSVEREYTLDAFTVGNLANGECGVHSGAAAGDDDPSEELDTLFATFHNAAVHLDGVADIEISDVLLQLLLLDLLNDMHGVLLRGK